MPATKLDVAAAGYVEQARAAWAECVELTFATPEQHIDQVAETVAKHTGQTKSNLKRKMFGIRYQNSMGYDKEEIKAMGQERVLSAIARKSNQDKYEQTTVMKWQIPGSLREVIRQDMARICNILDIKTTEELWDFLHSVFVDLTANPDSLKHLASDLRPPKEEHASQKRSS